MAGVTSTGFLRPTVQELLSAIETDQLSEISPTLDVSADGILGQLNGIFANDLGVLYEAVEAAYGAFDPDRAEGDSLTSLAKLTGTERRPASYSRVTVAVDLDEGVTLVSGTHFAANEDHTDVRWTPQEDFTSDADGSHDVEFRAEFTGPVSAGSGEITVIATPVVGWNDVGNAAAASLGRVADDDVTLRSRREAQLTRAGSSTMDAIRADILEIESVEDVLMFENAAPQADSLGRPPHSFEAVVLGAGGADEDDAIAQAIWDTRPAGIRSFSFSGDSGTAEDANGDEHPVGFSRAEAVEVYLAYAVVPSDGYVGDSAFEAAVAARCNELFGIGADVRHSRAQSIPFELQLGVEDVTVEIGTSPSPSETADIEITSRQIARFSTATITVDSAP